ERFRRHLVEVVGPDLLVRDPKDVVVERVRVDRSIGSRLGGRRFAWLGTAIFLIRGTSGVDVEHPDVDGGRNPGLGKGGSWAAYGGLRAQINRIRSVILRFGRQTQADRLLVSRIGGRCAVRRLVA